MSYERIIQQLIGFVRKNGKLPRPDEPGLKELIQEAIEEFGSLDGALTMAGLSIKNRDVKKQGSFSEKIRHILNSNPMTLFEIRRELKVGSDFSPRIKSSINNDKKIKSIGPRRKKVYFFEGQEILAQTKLDKIMNEIPKLEEKIFCLLQTPMTKLMLLNSLFGDKYSTHQKSKINTYLRELMWAHLIYEAKFVIKKGRYSKKFTSKDFFGDLADKLFYCRFDCPIEVADLVIQNIINLETGIDEIEKITLKDKRNRQLKRMLPPKTYQLIKSFLID